MSGPADVNMMSNDSVWIFVDNPYLLVGKKAQGRSLGEGYQDDPKWRIHEGRLMGYVSNGRSIIRRIVYGLQSNDAVRKNAEKNNYEVKVFNGSYHYQLVNDVTKLVCKDDRKRGSTVIIVSGDRDIHPCIETAVEEGWRVEVWGMEKAIRSDLQKLKENHPERLKVETLTGEEDFFFQDRKLKMDVQDMRELDKKALVFTGCREEIDMPKHSIEWLELEKVLNDQNATWWYHWLDKTPQFPGDNLLIKFDFQIFEGIDSLAKELSARCKGKYCINVMSYYSFCQEGEKPVGNIQNNIRDRSNGLEMEVDAGAGGAAADSEDGFQVVRGKGRKNRNEIN